MNSKERIKIATDIYLKGVANVVLNPDHLYKPLNGDILVVGPMKSGTTWMQQILHQIRTKGDESFSDIYGVTQSIVNPSRQMTNVNNVQKEYNRRIFKHHEAFGVIRSTDKQKIVIIVRDPYDAAFSMSKFFTGFYGDDGSLSEQETIDMTMLIHEKSTCANFSCISTWWQHRNDANVLFLFYEDLKHDLETLIRKITEFVEIPLSEDELRRVCFLCSFEYMAKHKEKFQGENVAEMLAKLMNVEKWTPKVGMVRTDGGKVGQGSTKLDPRLKSTVDRLWKDIVQCQTGLGSYQELYDSHGIFQKK